MKLTHTNVRYLSAFVIASLAVAAIGCDLSINLLSSSIGTANGFGAKSGLVTSVKSSADKDDKIELPPATDLVKDWDQPDVTLFVTGRLHGYIEPCGCTGLENQKGGLMRRHTVQKILKKRGWDLVSIDAGNHIRRFGQQPVIKLQKTYEAICKIMNYDVAGFGPDDLKIPTIELLSAMLNAKEDDQQNPFTACNVAVIDPEMTNSFRIIEKNGRKIGITTLIGDEHFKDLKKQSDLTLIGMKLALQQTIPKMKAQNCDMMVLVAQTSEENCVALAKQYPFFDLLVTTSGAGDPWLLPQQIKSPQGHVTQMIQVGVKGMYVGLVGLYVGANGNKRLKYERVALDHRYEDSPEMTAMFHRYQKELEALYKAGANQDIRPRQHPSGNKFAGSESCNDCHDEEYEIWLDGMDGDGGPHAKATADIIKPPNDRGGIARHFDPECISCHVTGWNPQNFYPYETGFMKAANELLHGNGCENCHGPAAEHVAAEKANKNIKLMKRLRQQLQVTRKQAEAGACLECHDIDNSPDFAKDGAFDEYWERIEHGDGEPNDNSIQE